MPSIDSELDELIEQVVSIPHDVASALTVQETKPAQFEVESIKLHNQAISEAKAKLLAIINDRERLARIETLRSLPDVRLGGDDTQWFEDYLWEEIKKLEQLSSPPQEGN